MNRTRIWKKALSLLMAVLMVLSMMPISPLMTVEANAVGDTYVFLKPNSNWTQSNARFAIYVWKSSGGTPAWYNMTDEDGDGIYMAYVPADYDNIIFCRMNPGTTANNWNEGTKWDQTNDLKVPTNGKHLYSVATGAWSNGDGSWSEASFSVSYTGSYYSKNNTNNAKYGTDYEVKFTANTGYTLPDSITVKIGGKTVSNYTYDASTGSLRIPGGSITGKVAISVNPTKKVITCNVDFQGTNVTSDGAEQATSDKSYTANLTPATGYVLPAAIEVKVGGATLTSGYSYNSSTGALSINAASLTGDVVITAVTNERIKYDVTYTLVGIVNKNGENICTHGQSFTATLTLADGYTTPVAIEVVVGGKILTEGTDFTYDNGNGVFTIQGDAVTGDIVITASGTAKTYQVSFNLTNLSATNGDNSCTYNTAYTATLAAVSGFELPEKIEVVVNGAILSEGYTYNKDTGVVTIEGAYVTGDIQITAVAETQKVNVTVNGNYVTFSGDTKVPMGQECQVTLTPYSNYIMPSTIKVTAGGTNLTSGTDYTYNKTTGNVTIRGSAVTGDIVITVNIISRYVFLKPGPWEADGAVFVVHYWYDNGDYGDVTMTLNAADGIYYAEIPADVVNLLFFRNNPHGGVWNQTDDLQIQNNKNLFTITGWGSNGGNSTGTWSNYTGTITPSVSGEELADFYVNTDIVDYLNDYRVNYGPVNGYSDNNQGIWMNTPGNPVFSYLNHIISTNAVDKNGETKYSYPLYFGNLLFISSRFGTTYQSFTNETGYKNHRDNNKESLYNWNTGANVALDNNGDWTAVVQGLVGDHLDEHGQLLDPETDEQLFYFDKTAIESWTTSITGGKRLMAYYSNLQFPFKTTYDPDTRVTTYSYDSAKDNAVFIDYDNYDADAKTNPMYTNSNYAKDENNAKGFFPLNKPGDSSNASNYGFGVKFTIDFTVSDDGTIVSADGTQTPVEFSFTGDDDVWVFIDDQLVLDMGGAHAMATGTIDFQSLTATVGKAAQVSDQYYDPSYYNISYGYNGDGAQRESLTIESNKTTAFPEALAEAFRNEYNTGISNVHKLTMFYMERGNIESNMSIQFSMSPIPTGLTVSKDIDNVNPGLNDDVQDDDEFSFTIDATDADGNKVTFDGYDLTDHGNITTDGIINGNIISGIRGDRYAHNFTIGNLSAFTAGTKFVITEGDYDTNKYSATRWVVYEYSNGYKKVGEGTSVEAAFEMLENSSGNYALNFVNSLKASTLTLSKTYADTLIDSSNMEFLFEIYLDVDGEGYKLHPGLTYDLYNGTTLVEANKISDDGKITLKAGQTVSINGIPVGTMYKVVEVDDSDLWEVVGSAEISGTMTTDGAAVQFKNKTTATDLDKVIFVEAGNGNTYYSIADGSESITLNSVSSNDGEKLSAEIIDGKVKVIASDAGQAYSFEYAGTYSNGAYVSGTVTVYTFAATHKTYVFDFGLASDLAATTVNGDGLFQGGYFFNDHIEGTTAMLNTLIGKDNSQTAISINESAWIYSDGESAQVLFQPIAFMSSVESYTYTVQIIAPNQEFDPDNPETGCIVTGSIQVMPANTVYYEDNFNVTGNNSTQKIIFGGGAVGQNHAPDMKQSNAQSTNYGYDGCYNGGYQYSGGQAVTLDNMQYAYFTFVGNGFDLISRTAADTAGMVVYVFAGGHDDAYIDYLTNMDSAKQPVDMVIVNTYYFNGDLHQVPVASVRLGGLAQTYSVYIQCLSTGTGSSVQLDGVRIYNPLGQNTGAYLKGEQNTGIDELRVLYKNNYVSLAGYNRTDGIFVGTGKPSIIENTAPGKYTTAGDLANVFQHGPNNEMYLPESFGIRLRYTVDSKETFSLQVGAKALGSAKTMAVYARVKDTGSYAKVGTVNIASTTDMYYDLTAMLKDYSAQGTSYDLVLISESPDDTNQFISLTTVKHSGMTLIAKNQ